MKNSATKTIVKFHAITELTWPWSYSLLSNTASICKLICASSNSFRNLFNLKFSSKFTLKISPFKYESKKIDFDCNMSHCDLQPSWVEIQNSLT